MITAVAAFSGFSVDDIEAARKFYVDTLQLTLADESMGLSLELPGGGQHFIYEKKDHVPAEYTTLNFVVENIDDAVDHLAGHHGITFERYSDMPGSQDEKGIMRGKASNEGPDIAWFKDPAGNILAVLEN
jgi:catechol 2,3-dioxygenase-like lactoylglutathione lyase family enzyme